TLSWDEANLAGLGTRFTNRQVAGYRLFRSPAANATLGEVTFLNDLSGAATTTYTDNGQAPVLNTISGCAAFPPQAGQKPLALGETSRWVSAGVPQLNQARKGAGVVPVVDKCGAGPCDVFVYAMSGLDDAGAGLSDYELLVLAHDPATNPTLWELAPWVQVAGAVAAVPVGAGAPPSCSAYGGQATSRWQASLFLFNRESSSKDGSTYAITNDEQYLYFGPGRNPAGANRGMLQSFRIGPGGVLAGYNLMCQTAAEASGYGNIGANKQIFTFGGDGVVANQVKAIEWFRQSVNANCTSNDAPCLSIAATYDDNGTNMESARYLHGSVLDRAYIYLVGGQTSAAATTALDSMEFGLW
ncbi:MAG: hypothetical protein HYZ27_09315, partial [Deltaproteobacteria bacterium]|nr:hypothetical protein [Deltaproteobacteria bacterium]